MKSEIRTLLNSDDTPFPALNKPGARSPTDHFEKFWTSATGESFGLSMMIQTVLGTVGRRVNFKHLQEKAAF